MATKDKLEELNLSRDELDRLGKAFKNEEFRKLFAEYAEEISNPENRKRYEEEIKIMEGERGMDVKFVHPNPGHVIKTSVDGKMKAFINICTNDNIKQPSSTKQVGPDGKHGLQWTIPHSFSPAREDVDKDENKCKVYDVVFHPDTYRMTETSVRFKKIVHDTALDGIEKQFGVKLDKKNIKFPKIKFKGTPNATIIRNKKAEGAKQRDPDDIVNQIPFPYDADMTSEEKAMKQRKEIERKKEKELDEKLAVKEEKSDYTEPKYTIKHSSVLDMQDFCNDREAGSNTRPKELVIEVELPQLKSAGPVNLDIFEKRLLLESTTPAKYKLDVRLPYSVDENEGSAKFDKSKRKLVITLPVLTPKISNVPFSGNCNGQDDSEKMEEEMQLTGDDFALDQSGKAYTELQQKPLIEVLSQNDSGIQDCTSPCVINGTEVDDNADKPKKDIWEVQDGSSSEEPIIRYCLPHFDYTQDPKSVTIISHVKNVSQESVMKTFFTGGSGLQLKFVSMGDGCFPVHFSLVLQFPFGCRIEADGSQVDVTRDNVVVLVKKKEGCAGIWDVFHAGVDQDHMEEKLFLTDRNLRAELDELDEESMPCQKKTTPEFQVTEMNEDHITVEIRDKDDQVPATPAKAVSESGDEIEVVHEQVNPKLKPIIKQRNRTISESSDDILCCSLNSRNSSESPISESEEGVEVTPGRKKSVSFSEYIDRTTYKTNQSVSTMHASLKNRRRRHRKREEKQEKTRRRRRSSGSEGGHSSDDYNSSEYSSQHSEPDDQDLQTCPDLIQEPKLVTKPVPVQRTDSNSSTECLDVNPDPAHQPPETSGKNKRKNRNKKTKHANKNLAQMPKPLIKDLSANAGFDKDDCKDTCAVGQNRGDDTKAECNSTSLEIGEEMPSSVMDIVVPDMLEKPDQICDNVEPLDGGDTANGVNVDYESPGNLDPDSDLRDDRTSLSDEKEDDVQDKTKYGGNPLITEATKSETIVNGKADTGEEGSDPVETMLAWQEPGKAAKQEHATKCAFSFSNNVVYDLDLD